MAVPVDYTAVDAIAAAVADIYAEAENALIAAMTRQLQAGGFDDPAAGVWQARKLAEVRALRRTAQLLVDDLDTHGTAAVRRAVADGWRSGNATALTDLTEQHIGDVGPAGRVAGQAAAAVGTRVQVLADAVVGELRPAHAAVLRSVDDTYRRAVAGGVARKLAGARDLRSAVQDAWTGMARRGLTGFVDGAGRRWRLFTYAEMAVRTAVARAAVAAQVDTMTAAGIGMCYVVDNPRECERCRPWESKILALHAPAALPAVGTLDEAMTAGLFHPNCFPAGVLVSAPSGVRAADSRWYDGELIIIHTAGGKELPVTPNHPVLTPEGWVAAGALKVGQDVLRYRAWDQRVGAAVTAGRPGDKDVPTPIGDVYEALAQASPVPAVRVPPAAEQFHGDGGHGEVDVVFADSLLANGELAGLGEGLHDGPLVVGGAGLGPLSAEGAPLQVAGGAARTAYGLVRGGDLGGSLLCRHGRPLAPFRFPGVGAVAVVEQGAAHGGLGPAKPVSDLPLRDAPQVEADGLGYPPAVPLAGNAGGGEPAEDDLAPYPERCGQVVGRFARPVPAGQVLNLRRAEFGAAVLGAPAPRHASGVEPGRHGGAGNAEGGSELARRLAGLVSADQVLKLERRQFAGHVYNLQSGGGWYVAGGIVVHNCRHTVRPWRPGVRVVAARKPDPGGYDAEQRQRALERRLRGWREQYAAAFDDTGRQRAARRIAAAAHALAEHLDAHPRLPRKTYREHPGAGFVAPRAGRTRRDAAHLAARP